MKIWDLIIMEFDKNFIDDLSNQFDINYYNFDFEENYGDLTNQIIYKIYEEKINSLSFEWLKISQKIKDKIIEKLIERIHVNCLSSSIDYDFDNCCYDFNKKIASYLQNEWLIN